MAEQRLDPVEIQQVILRSLRLQAAQLRTQARSRRLAGPQHIQRRAAMREEAARCAQVSLMILRVNPAELEAVLPS